MLQNQSWIFREKKHIKSKRSKKVKAGISEMRFLFFSAQLEEQNHQEPKKEWIYEIILS